MEQLKEVGRDHWPKMGGLARFSLRVSEVTNKKQKKFLWCFLYSLSNLCKIHDIFLISSSNFSQSSFKMFVEFSLKFL